MKNFFICLLSVLIFSSCEEVIDLELNEAPPKLTIEASINWQKGTPGNEQSVKLSLSAPFFDSDTPPANGATVTITDSKNTFNFIEDGNSGIYKTDSFIPDFNETYSLKINYNNEEYVAKNERLIPVVKIDSVVRSNAGTIGGSAITVKAFYTDPLNVDSDNDGIKEKNFYFFEYFYKHSNSGNEDYILGLSVENDEFNDGKVGFSFFDNSFYSSNDEIITTIHGVSESFYEFTYLLLQQQNNGGIGPFATPTATVRGNCINTTNPKNFPFGYFRLSEVDKASYLITFDAPPVNF